MASCDSDESESGDVDGSIHYECMTTFVSSLFCRTKDISTLSKRIVRDYYLQYIGADQLVRHEKDCLNLVIGEQLPLYIKDHTQVVRSEITPSPINQSPHVTTTTKDTCVTNHKPANKHKRFSLEEAVEAVNVFSDDAHSDIQSESNTEDTPINTPIKSGTTHNDDCTPVKNHSKQKPVRVESDSNDVTPVKYVRTSKQARVESNDDDTPIKKLTIKKHGNRFREESDDNTPVKNIRTSRQDPVDGDDDITPVKSKTRKPPRGEVESNDDITPIKKVRTGRRRRVESDSNESDSSFKTRARLRGTDNDDMPSKRLRPRRAVATESDFNDVETLSEGRQSVTPTEDLDSESGDDDIPIGQLKRKLQETKSHDNLPPDSLHSDDDTISPKCGIRKTRKRVSATIKCDGETAELPSNVEDLSKSCDISDSNTNLNHLYNDELTDDCEVNDVIDVSSPIEQSFSPVVVDNDVDNNVDNTIDNDEVENTDTCPKTGDVSTSKNIPETSRDIIEISSESDNRTDTDINDNSGTFSVSTKKALKNFKSKLDSFKSIKLPKVKRSNKTDNPGEDRIDLASDDSDNDDIQLSVIRDRSIAKRTRSSNDDPIYV